MGDAGQSPKQIEEPLGATGCKKTGDLYEISFRAPAVAPGPDFYGLRCRLSRSPGGQLCRQGLPIQIRRAPSPGQAALLHSGSAAERCRSEEHTSELQSQF